MRDPSIPTHSLPLDKIIVAPARGRSDFAPSRISDLAEDIKKNGLYNPILVSRENGAFTLVAGECRVRAYQHLYINAEKGEREQWSHIDARIREELSPLQMKEIELHENIKRSDLNELEKSKLVMQIHDLKIAALGKVRNVGETGWSLQKTADLVNIKSKGVVSNMIKIGRALESNPSLARVFKDKPHNAIIRELEKMDERSRLARLQESGQLVIDHELVLGDARVEMVKLAANSFHLVLTDPPFGIPRLTEMEGDSRDKTMSYLGDMKPADNLTLDKVIKLMEIIVPQITRVLVDGGHFYIFTCYEFYPYLIQELRLQNSLDFDPVPLTWDKGETTAPFMGYRYAPCSEPILFGWKRNPLHPLGYGRKLNGPASSLLRFKPLVNKTHPFEKPSSLLKFLIEQSTHSGERVCDPFAGSGAVLRASREIGRSAWGCELERDHWVLAQGLLTKKESL